MSCSMGNTVGKENKNEKPNYKYPLRNQGRECPLLFVIASHLPSRNSGNSTGWYTVGLQRRPNLVSFQQVFYCVLFHWGVGFFCQPLSILLVLVAQQGQKRPPGSVSLRTFDWQTAELLFSHKAVAVCLARAKTLHVDCFLGIWAWNVCFSNLLRSVQSEPVSGPPWLDISPCRESAFWPPSRQTGRRQQSFTRIPRKTCWEHWNFSGPAFGGCARK